MAAAVELLEAHVPIWDDLGMGLKKTDHIFVAMILYTVYMSYLYAGQKEA